MLGWIAVRYRLNRWGAIAVRMTVAGICCFAGYSSWKLARADYLFRKDTANSVHMAITWAPDAWAYYLRLSQLEPEHAAELLEWALHLNRYDAQADIELGLRYEADQQYGRAEKLMLAAFEVDHTYLPRWSLANFYLRRDNMPAFWTWAQSAALMPSDNISPLFELCWREAQDPDQIARAVLSNDPEVIRQFVRFLLKKRQVPAASVASSRLVRFSNAEEDRPLLLSVLNQLVSDEHAHEASSLWELLTQHQWVVADATLPNNGRFAREPIPASFDWSLPSYTGLHSWPGQSGLETEFGGNQPENCIVAEQAMVVKPGNYIMEYSFLTVNVPPDNGLHWELGSAKSGTALARSSDLSSDSMKKETLEFSVPPDVSLLHLRLVYRRALGTARISGTVVVPSVQIRVRPQS